MSYRLQPLIWNTDMKPGQRFVMLALVDYADDNGRNIYPSIETLSKKTGYSERNVQRILKSLEVELESAVAAFNAASDRHESNPTEESQNDVTAKLNEMLSLDKKLREARRKYHAKK